MKSIYCIFIAIILFFSSCSTDSVYQENRTISPKGWSMRDTLHYTLPVPQDDKNYQLQLLVRHDANYDYQSLWLFLRDKAQEVDQNTDTLEIPLADAYGRWIGESAGTLYTQRFLWLDTIQGSSTDTLHLSIIHGMRDTLLLHLSDIGIRLVPLKPPTHE